MQHSPNITGTAIPLPVCGSGPPEPDVVVVLP
jgi:hypothetical protein